jgi:hypothetical protein
MKKHSGSIEDFNPEHYTQEEFFMISEFLEENSIKYVKPADESDYSVTVNVPDTIEDMVKTIKDS